MYLAPGVNPLVGTLMATEASAAAVETSAPGSAPAILSGEAGVEWYVAALALSALGVLILFKMAGFQGTIAVRVGG